MFSHRGLFLAVTISLASVALAGVLVQPSYEYQYYSNEYQYYSNPRYSVSTNSSKSEIIAHDNNVAAKSSLTDAKHPTTINPFLAEAIDRRLKSCQTVKNFLLSSRMGSAILLTNTTLPEYEPTDLPNDKRLENCQVENNFIILYNQIFLNALKAISSANIPPRYEPHTPNDKRLENCLAVVRYLGSTRMDTILPLRNITRPEHEPTDLPNDKRLENCHIVKNVLLGIRLGSTISLTNILRKHEPTDTNDKRLENCQADNNVIIFYIQLFMNSLKAISSTNITLPEHEPTDTNDEHVKICQGVINFILNIQRTLNYLKAISLGDWTSEYISKPPFPLNRQNIRQGGPFRVPPFVG